MASSLKIKLAAKIKSELDIDINPEDIDFPRNGCRNDVVRWAIFGYECFSTGKHSAKDDVGMVISEYPQVYGTTEIFIEPPC